MNSIEKIKIDEKILFTVALGSVFLGGLWVRISGVSEYYPNPDELEFLIIAKGENLAEVWRRGLAELHPPLAHFIRHYLLMISSDVFHQRLFGVVAGMLSIMGMYLLGFQLRGRFLGLFCAACMAFFPVAVSTSVTIRNYAFFMAFLSWALFFFFKYQAQEKRMDLIIFTVLLFLASATHFTGFLVGAALGISEGLRLISAKRWNSFAVLCISFLPLVLLGVFFYFHYLAPGTAGPLWSRFSGTDEMDFSGIVSATFQYILLYLAPLYTIVQPNSDTHLAILVFTTLLLFSAYIRGLFIMYKQKAPTFNLILILWGITIFAALANLYPFFPNRRSYYLLPFMALSLGYGFEDFVRSMPQHRLSKYLGAMLIVLTVFFLKQQAIYLKYDEELSLKNKDFNAGQLFLHQRLRTKDIITGSYHYFLYAKDAGITPYDSYKDVTYYYKTTVLSPFNRPFKSNQWWSFRDNLKSRLASNITKSESHAWFVMYAWEGMEIWPLINNCDAIKPQIDNYFSRDGVLIFSIQVKVLANFLKNNKAWNLCYADYKSPLEFAVLKSRPQNATN